jgi:hypothetical protein
MRDEITALANDAKVHGRFEPVPNPLYRCGVKPDMLAFRHLQTGLVICTEKLHGTGVAVRLLLRVPAERSFLDWLLIRVRHKWKVIPTCAEESVRLNNAYLQLCREFAQPSEGTLLLKEAFKMKKEDYEQVKTKAEEP